MRAVCIHGHFYQPPREDPWFDEVLADPSAAPAHDWNDRVAMECYRPNRAARLMDGAGRIVCIMDNYRHLSFNFGPTLHRWIARHDPVLDARLRASDGEAERELGAGGALAQAYNHMILPLASARDLRTQVRWGAADFRARFGRRSRGMWLPETAVSTSVLEALAEEGVEFTILASGQCAAVRPPRGEWTPVSGGSVDVTRPYTVPLPSGKHVTVVFYQGSVSHDIAFGGLLDSGDRFAEYLLHQLPGGDEPRLLVVATDGETYGHHHRFGEMALARAFQVLASSREALLTNVGAFLQLHPPTWEARIVENSSWSCVHGVERWRSDCGCHTGGEPGWHQRWRQPLRHALDRFREVLDQEFEERLRPWCDNPWGLRDEAVALVLDEGGEEPREFLRSRFGTLSPEAARTILTLLEAQRMGMFQYTSCGWFFNDVAGIETAQILSYALRGVELLRSVGGPDLEERLKEDLTAAEGNRPTFATGAEVLEKMVAPGRRSLEDLAAAALLRRDVASLPQEEGTELPERGESFRHSAVRFSLKGRSWTSGELMLRGANIRVSDRRTGETWTGSGAVLSSGGLDDVCRLRREETSSFEELRRAFFEGDLLALGRTVEKNFPLGPWHLDVLSRDDREAVARERCSQAENAQRGDACHVLEDFKRLLMRLHAIGVEPPAILRTSAEFCLSAQVRDLVQRGRRDVERGDEGAAGVFSRTVATLLEPGSPLVNLLEEAHALGMEPELSLLRPRLECFFHDRLEDHRLGRSSEAPYAALLAVFQRTGELRMTLNLWRAQNELWRLLEEVGNAPGEDMLALARAWGFATPEEKTPS